MIKLIDSTTYIIGKDSCRYEGLFIHGYGSNKHENLLLIEKICKNLPVKIVAFDLAGHGNNDDIFNLKNAIYSIKSASKNIAKTDFFIGHSVGAFLGSYLELNNPILISMPQKAEFSGDKKELISMLRAKNVREVKPYFGLGEILAETITPPKCSSIFIKADNDLASVSEVYDKWSNKITRCLEIENTDHLSVLKNIKTLNSINNWLSEVLR